MRKKQKQTYQNKIERLEYVNSLLRSGWHTYNEILNKFQSKFGEKVEIRTIQMYFKEIRDNSGNVIESQFRPGVGKDYKNDKRDDSIKTKEKEFRYKIGKDFSYFEPSVTTDDIKILNEAITALRKYEGFELATELYEVATKLYKGNAQLGELDNLYFQPFNQKGYKGTKYLFDLLDCCRNQTVLKLSYQSYKTQIKVESLFHPYILKEWNGRWYLIGYDEIDQRISNKALDRIKSLKTTFNEFKPTDLKHLTKQYDEVFGITLFDDQKVEKFIFKVLNTRAEYIESKPIHPTQTRTIDGDYSIFTIKVRANNELFALLMSYGSDLEVLEPEWMRERIRENLAQTLKLYKSKK